MVWSSWSGTSYASQLILEMAQRKIVVRVRSHWRSIGGQALPCCITSLNTITHYLLIMMTKRITLNIGKAVALCPSSTISAWMAVFYKTRNQIISTVIIQINPFYGCLKASSNRYLLFTVHPLSSNSDIVKLRSYKRLWESDCLALIQPASVLGGLWM